MKPLRPGIAAWLDWTARKHNRNWVTTNKAKLYKRGIGDVIEEVFGFRPGTPEATQFWKEHGGTAPC